MSPRHFSSSLYSCLPCSHSYTEMAVGYSKYCISCQQQRWKKPNKKHGYHAERCISKFCCLKRANNNKTQATDLLRSLLMPRVLDHTLITWMRCCYESVWPKLHYDILHPCCIYIVFRKYKNPSSYCISDSLLAFMVSANLIISLIDATRRCSRSASDARLSDPFCLMKSTNRMEVRHLRQHRCNANASQYSRCSYYKCLQIKIKKAIRRHGRCRRELGAYSELIKLIKADQSLWLIGRMYSTVRELFCTWQSGPSFCRVALTVAISILYWKFPRSSFFHWLDLITYWSALYLHVHPSLYTMRQPLSLLASHAVATLHSGFYYTEITSEKGLASTASSLVVASPECQDLSESTSIRSKSKHTN